MTAVNQIPAKPDVKICERNRFTEFIGSENSESFRSLYRWLDWFRSRGIPARLHHSKAKGFAVYRENLTYEE